MPISQDKRPLDAPEVPPFRGHMAYSNDQFRDAVLVVLSGASTGKSGLAYRHFLTSYQVLHRLPDAMREQLIDEYGQPGHGAGKNYTAASRVSDYLEPMVNSGVVEPGYLDTGDMTFTVGGNPTVAGYESCGLYRLK
jgi:hypothetical protein